MLTIVLPKTETLDEVTVKFEHSLLSLSKWESIHEKPFFVVDPSEERTLEEIDDYVRCMVVSPDLPRDFTSRLNEKDYVRIMEYTNSKQSGTTFTDEPKSTAKAEPMTSELVYYWMMEFGIDFQPCESWHLNRLLTLIKIASIKRAPAKKMNSKEQAEHMRRLNAQRRQKLNTSG